MAETDKDNNKNCGYSEKWDGIIKIRQQLDDLEKQSLSKRSSSRKSSSADGSTLEAILYMIGGLVVMGIVFTSLGVDARGVPAFLLIVLWFVFAIIIMVVVLCIGSRKH